MLLCNWAGPFLVHQSLKLFMQSSSHIVFVLPSPSLLQMPEPSYLDLASTLLPCPVEDVTMKPRTPHMYHRDDQNSFQQNRLYIYACLIFWEDVLAIRASFLCPEVRIGASPPNPSTSNKDTTISHSTSVGLNISLSTLIVSLLLRMCRLRHPDLDWRALRRTQLHLLEEKAMRQSSTSLTLYPLPKIRCQSALRRARAGGIVAIASSAGAGWCC